MKILVIGEYCLDVFWYGESTRISPEGNYPIFVPTRKTINAGMGGNVEGNLKEFGVITDLISQDEVISKVRYVSQRFNQGIVRVDTEDDVKRITKMRLKSIDFSEWDMVIISDYDKGFLHEDDIQWISEQHELTLLDTKKKLSGWINDIRFVKLSRTEYENNKKYVDSHFDQEKFIITLDKDGCIWNGNKFDVKQVEIVDVAGAGDTFIASFSYNFIKTKSVEESIKFANKCATQVVQHRGVCVINLDEI
jgi:D-beta-D-heptose 7-phosphate kinase/D-beta-D-heptose 1-phosphate adenosyltransferase